MLTLAKTEFLWIYFEHPHIVFVNIFTEKELLKCLCFHIDQAKIVGFITLNKLFI